MSTLSINTLPRALALFSSALLRAMLALVGLVMLMGVATLLTAVAASWMLVARLRGRRPQAVRFDWRGLRGLGEFSGFRNVPRAGQPGGGAGDVIDVQAREITPSQRR